jgi:hypothetical protein
MKKFFERVLPDGGSYSLLALSKGSPPLELNGIPTFDALVHRATQASTSPLDVYYAVGSYKPSGRRGEEALAKRALFLDLDAKDFGSKAGTLTALNTFVRSVGLPAPAIVVDSGGGYHVYWPFAEPLEVAAWRALALALKAACKSTGFDADPTATADAARVLRIPGTLNHKYIPPRPVQVLQDTGAVFEPADLFRALQPQQVALADTALPVPKSALDTSINDDLAGGTSYDPLTSTEVESMLKAIVIPSTGNERRNTWTLVLAALKDWDQGEEGFKLADAWSSSQAAYRGTADVRKTWDSFVRSDGPKVTIGTIVKMAKDAGWSGPVAEDDHDVVDVSSQGFIAEAVRADVRAQESLARGRNRLTIEEARSTLTSDFIYVENQGTYYSIGRRNCLGKEVIDDLNAWRMPRSSNGASLSAVTILKNSPNTRQVDSLGFAPGQSFVFSENNRRYVNRYVDPPPEVVPAKAEAELFRDLCDYLFPRPGDQAFKRYWLQYMGHVVQKPQTKIATALLFISEKEGIGKTLALYDIPRLLVGVDNATKVTNDDLEGRFTGYLGNAHLLHLEEIHVNGHWSSSKIANKLKAVITDATVRVEQKGLDVYNIPNRLVVTATSNYNDAMFISSRQERRWGIYELSPDRAYSESQHRKYFDLIHRFLASDRAAGVLRFIFGRINLAGFNPQTPPPMTLAKQRMSVLSMSEECQVIHDAMANGLTPFHRDLFQIDEVRGLLKTELNKVVSSKWAAQQLLRVVPDATMTRTRIGQGVVRVWCWKNQSQWRGVIGDTIKKELER